jgi:pimeloyl-ACP methyl ester carboxylesterase
MIDVGGRRLHFYSAGEGEPTVLIETGIGGHSAHWVEVIRSIAADARACVYDRAGMGWSDAASWPADLEAFVDDAEALLAKVACNGPLVLIGHSFGGFLVRRLVQRLPDRVKGVVLVDSSEESYTFSPIGMRYLEIARHNALRKAWAARVGLLRLLVTVWPERFDPARRLAADQQGERRATYLRADRHFQEARELLALMRLPADARHSGGLGRLGDIPLVVVSRPPATPMSPEEAAWQEAQRRLCSLSGVSRQLVARGGGHLVQFDDPAIIIEAVRLVLGR